MRTGAQDDDFQVLIWAKAWRMTRSSIELIRPFASARGMMRFGSMFSIEDPSAAGSLKLMPKKKVLELTLTPEGAALYGEVAQARFKSLALALGAMPQVRTAA